MSLRKVYPITKCSLRQEWNKTEHQDENQDVELPRGIIVHRLGLDSLIQATPTRGVPNDPRAPTERWFIYLSAFVSKLTSLNKKPPISSEGLRARNRRII